MMTSEEARLIIGQYDMNFYNNDGTRIPAEDIAEAFELASEALEDVDALRNETLNPVYVVMYWDDTDVAEPTVTIFDNQDAALACYEKFRNEHEACTLDCKVPVYREFIVRED